MPRERALELLERDYGLNSYAADNLQRYLDEQRDATRVVPSDRTVVVERFRDEIGDWRLCVLTPFGGRIHAAWALAISARLRDERGLDPDAIWSDDGVILHLPDADQPPPADVAMLSADEVEDLITAELGSTALFGSRFREAAARSLLIPRRSPDRRMPLWQQRLRAQGLLQIARRYGEFPVILETYREILSDWLDLPALKRLLARLESREVSLVEVDTPNASPFAQSLLFDYIATYMYEGDVPRAEQRAAALALDRDLLRELLGTEELRELIDPDALASVEEDLQHLSAKRLAGDADQAHDLLRRLGDLSDAELSVRTVPGIDAQSLADATRHRAPRGEAADRRRAALDRGAGRRPLSRRGRSDSAGWTARSLPRAGRGGARPAAPALRAHARPLHDRRRRGPVRLARGADRDSARRAGDSRGAGAGRDPSRGRRIGARVVRPGGPAPPAPGEHRCAPPGDRADRPGDAAALRARLARDRPVSP